VATRNELRLESLIGRCVYDPDGQRVGRLEEFVAEPEGEHWAVTRFHIGPAALLERLAVRHLGVTFGRRPKGYEATWEQVSLDNPDRPVLNCRIEDLRRVRR
jgi:sporulation protein YlmC with PRC-barrel domain